MNPSESLGRSPNGPADGLLFFSRPGGVVVGSNNEFAPALLQTGNGLPIWIPNALGICTTTMT